LKTPLHLALGMTVFAAASCVLVLGLSEDRGAETAVLFSALLATVNGIGALALSHFGARWSSTKAFFGAVFGGMVLRMGLTLAGFVIGLKVLDLPEVPLAAALLTFTALFTAAETAVWSKQNFSPRVPQS
jgi:hypothetical protein